MTSHPKDHLDELKKKPQRLRQTSSQKEQSVTAKSAGTAVAAEPEIGGPEGPEPTRYGDWDAGGRCTDF